MTLPLPDSTELRAKAALSSLRHAPSHALHPEGFKPLDLAGRRVLVIEDEPLVGLELTALLTDWNIEVVGPLATHDDALQAAATLDVEAVLLDANLNGSSVDEIAAMLTGRSIPFVFVTGYGPESLPPSFRNAPRLSKPFKNSDVLHVLTRLIAPSTTASSAMIAAAQ